MKEINPELLKEVEKKTGMNSQEIDKVLKNGDISGITKMMGKDGAQKLEKALSDKESAKKILSTPQAQALIKKFFGGK